MLGELGDAQAVGRVPESASRCTVDVEQGADVAVAMHAVVGVALPIRTQDADGEMFPVHEQLVVPDGEIDVKIKAGDR